MPFFVYVRNENQEIKLEYKDFHHFLNTFNEFKHKYLAGKSEIDFVYLKLETSGEREEFERGKAISEGAGWQCLEIAHTEHQKRIKSCPNVVLIMSEMEYEGIQKVWNRFVVQGEKVGYLDSENVGTKFVLFEDIKFSQHYPLKDGRCWSPPKTEADAKGTLSQNTNQLGNEQSTTDQSHQNPEAETPQFSTFSKIAQFFLHPNNYFLLAVIAFITASFFPLAWAPAFIGIAYSLGSLGLLTGIISLLLWPMESFFVFFEKGYLKEYIASNSGKIAIFACAALISVACIFFLAFSPLGLGLLHLMTTTSLHGLTVLGGVLSVESAMITVGMVLVVAPLVFAHSINRFIANVIEPFIDWIRNRSGVDISSKGGYSILDGEQASLSEPLEEEQLSSNSTETTMSTPFWSSAASFVRSVVSTFSSTPAGSTSTKVNQ